MSQKTSIEWTDMTWNPVRGCSRVSEGCRHCYAETMAARFSDPGMWGEGFARRTAAGGRWTGKVALIPEKLAEPLAWRSPRRCFVNSTSDLFHESLSFEHIAAVYGVMAACPHITFQVLTKRPERRREFMAATVGLETMAETVAREAAHRAGIVWDSRGSAVELYPIPPAAIANRRAWPGWPLPNVWEGASVEDQPTADARIPELLATPAAVRFLSVEPLLGPIDLRPWLKRCVRGASSSRWNDALSWVIVGGESGPSARPMHPEWARSLRDQCRAAGAAFFFKQWGEWAPLGQMDAAAVLQLRPRPRHHRTLPSAVPGRAASLVCPVGKRAAGRILDGLEYSMFPGDRWPKAGEGRG